MLRYDVSAAELADLLADGIVYTGDNDDQVIAWMDQACGSADKLPHVRDHGGFLSFWVGPHRRFVHLGDRVILGADGWFAVEVA
jgi:hypothetical protein